MLAVIIWLFVRKRRQSGSEDLHGAVHQADGDRAQMHQLDDTPTAYEVPEKTTYARTTELPAQSVPVELEGKHQDSSDARH